LIAFQVSAGETCTPQGDLIISSTKIGDVEDLSVPLNNLVCTPKLAEVKFEYDFIFPLVENTKLFCADERYKDVYCEPGTEVMKPFEEGSAQKLLEFTRESDAELASQAETKIPDFLCFYSLMQENFSDVLKNSITVDDAKAKMDVLFSVLDNKSAASLVSEIFRRWQRRLRTPAQNEKFKYMIDYLWNRENIQESDNILETLERITKAPTTRLDDSIRKRALYGLGKLAEKGDARAKEMVRGFTLQVENAEVKTMAEGIMVALETLSPDGETSGPTVTVTPTPTPRVDVPDRLERPLPPPVIASLGYTPPNCDAYTAAQERDSLFMSSEDMSIFETYFNDNYDVNVSSMDDAYKFILDNIKPTLENPGQWSDFVKDFLEDGAQADENKRKAIAEKVFCRSRKLNEIVTKLKEKPGNNVEKINTLTFLNQLPRNDALYLIEKTIGSNDDPNVLKTYLELMKDYGGSRVEGQLDDLFVRVPSMRTDIIKAFELDSIELGINSKIITELGKIKETPAGQAMIKELERILAKDQESRTKVATQKQALDSMATMPFSQFTSVLKTNFFVDAELNGKTKEELETLRLQGNEQVAELEKRIAELNAEMIEAQRGDVANPSDIFRELREKDNALRLLKRKMAEAAIRIKFKELENLEEGTPEFDAKKVAIISAISADLSKAESSTEDDGNMDVLLAIKRMVIDDANAGSDIPPTDDNGTGSGNVTGTPDEQRVIKDNPLVTHHEGIHNPNLAPDDTTAHAEPPVDRPSGHADPIDLDGKTSAEELNGGRGEPETVVNRPETKTGKEPRRDRLTGGNGTPDIDSPNIVIDKDDSDSPLSVNTSSDFESSPTIKPVINTADVDVPEVETDNSEYKIDFFDSNSDSPKAVENKPNRKAARNNVASTQNKGMVKTQIEVTDGSSNKKANFKTSDNSALKSEIADLQSEVDNLKVSNSELKTEQLRKEFDDALASNNSNGINKNFAVAKPGTQAASVKSGRNPASAPVGEVGGGSVSSAGSVGSGGSARGPSSNSALERKTFKAGQIDIASIGSRFVKDLDDSEAKKMGVMAVTVKNKDHEQHLLSLLSNPETATCSDLKFLDVFFNEHIAKVKFNKQGDAELLVQSGNIPLRVIKPSEKKVKALQDKYCSVAQNESENTRHTASIGADLENLPEEGSEEEAKALERKRSESGTLGKIIDGIKGFFD